MDPTEVSDLSRRRCPAFLSSACRCPGAGTLAALPTLSGLPHRSRGVVEGRARRSLVGTRSSDDRSSRTHHLEDLDVPGATFACPDLARSCRLDELGLQVTGAAAAFEPGGAGSPAAGIGSTRRVGPPPHGEAEEVLSGSPRRRPSPTVKDGRRDRTFRRGWTFVPRQVRHSYVPGPGSSDDRRRGPRNTPGDG